MGGLGCGRESLCHWVLASARGKLVLNGLCAAAAHGFLKLGQTPQDSQEKNAVDGFFMGSLENTLLVVWPR